MPAKIRIDRRSQGKAVLYRAVQDLGLTARQAVTAVETAIEAWRQALARHEDVELPLGLLRVRKGPAPRRVFRRGRLKYTKRSLFNVFRQPYTVKLSNAKGFE